MVITRIKKRPINVALFVGSLSALALSPVLHDFLDRFLVEAVASIVISVYILSSRKEKLLYGYTAIFLIYVTVWWAVNVEAFPFIMLWVFYQVIFICVLLKANQIAAHSSFKGSEPVINRLLPLIPVAVLIFYMADAGSSGTERYSGWFPSVLNFTGWLAAFVAPLMAFLIKTSKMLLLLVIACQVAYISVHSESASLVLIAALIILNIIFHVARIKRTPAVAAMLCGTACAIAYVTLSDLAISDRIRVERYLSLFDPFAYLEGPYSLPTLCTRYADEPEECFTTESYMVSNWVAYLPNMALFLTFLARSANPLLFFTLLSVPLFSGSLFTPLTVMTFLLSIDFYRKLLSERVYSTD